jgi:hypothetical protein
MCCYECGIESLCSVSSREFLDYLSNLQLVTDSCVPLSEFINSHTVTTEQRIIANLCPLYGLLFKSFIAGDVAFVL